MRRINNISIHCSATPTGSAVVFDKYHREHNGWSSIGYHFVIGNGITTDGYIKSLDGQIEVGRSLQKDPAAVRGYNRGMIAICLVGSNFDDFTEKQFESLRKLLNDLKKKYKIKNKNIKGHRDFSTPEHPIYKKCPCFNVKAFLKGKIKE
jgi:N-acetylmuramoyl-L-alanine amidase